MVSRKLKRIHSRDEFPQEDRQKQMDRIVSVLSQPPGGSAFQHIRELRDLLSWAHKMLTAQTYIINLQRDEIRAYENNVEFVNSRTPWTETEDSYLVERRANGESIQSLATALGRSPASVATRLSELVGITRRTVRIDGKRIEGTLEGLTVDGKFVGTVWVAGDLNPEPGD